MSTDQLLSAMDEVLEQGEALLTGLSDAQYADTYGGASVGAHYRHSLEHFKILFEAVHGGAVDYDRRERDRELENDRTIALRVTHDLRQAARFFASLPAGRTIEVQYKISYAAPGACAATSTIGREVMYAVSHAIHHYALIGAVCHGHGLPVPADFGLAPSTIAYRDAAARRSA
ncbi:MAG TPA: hypothetical protein VGM68_03340 [Rhizomicrobium sp.]|jgi:hypothetical protein